MLTELESTKSNSTRAAIPSKEWFVVYCGRRCFNFVGGCFTLFGSLVRKVKTFALSIFTKSSGVDNLSTTPPESPSLSIRSVKRIESSSSNTTSTASSSEGSDSETDSDQSVSTSDSSGESAHLSDSQSVIDIRPFSNWKPEEISLFATTMSRMCKHLAQKTSSKDEIADYEKNESKYFYEFHSKFRRVWNRMEPGENKESLKTSFDEYFRLTEPHPGMIGTVFNKVMNTIWATQPVNNQLTQPVDSPRIDIGGIPQVGNSCFLNALLQIIRLEHLNDIPPPPTDPKELEEYGKKKEIDTALRLMLRVKDDPNSGDAVWLAALMLRNLLYDTGLFPDLKIDELGYFRQQDATPCLDALLPNNKIKFIRLFEFIGQADLVKDLHPIDGFSYILLKWEHSDRLNFQDLVDKNFQPSQGDQDQRRSFKCIKIGDDRYHWESSPLSTEDDSSEACKLVDPKQFAEFDKDEKNKKYFTCMKTGENRYLIRKPPLKNDTTKTPVLVEVGSHAEVEDFNCMNVGENTYIVHPPASIASPVIRFPADICKEKTLIEAGNDAAEHPLLPNFLCVSLARFYNDGKGGTGKKEDPIQFPKNGIIDYSKIFDCVTDTPITYKLTGAVLHSGTLHGGHYTTCATRDNGASWCLYNDEHVGPVTPSIEGNIPPTIHEAIINHGSILYFEKVTQL